MPVQGRGRDDSRISSGIKHWGDLRPLLHRHPPSEATEWRTSDRISEEKGSTRFFASEKDGSAPKDDTGKSNNDPFCDRDDSQPSTADNFLTNCGHKLRNQRHDDHNPSLVV